MTVPEHPPGLAIRAAHRILADHQGDGRCTECRRGRCWLLEWAVRTLITSGEPKPAEVRHLLTRACRRIVASHWPTTAGGCWPCGLPDCDPMRYAATWLEVVDDDWMPAPRELPATVEILAPESTPTVSELRRITGMN